MKTFKKKTTPTFFLLFLCHIEPTCQNLEVACGQYKDKEGKNDEKLKNGPKMSIFKIFKNALEFYFILS